MKPKEQISIDEFDGKRFQITSNEQENNNKAVLTQCCEPVSKFITRDDFMDFFRDDESLNQLSPDDRAEVFSTILLGSSDFTKKLFDEIFSDYCVSRLEIIETPNE